MANAPIGTLIQKFVAEVEIVVHRRSLEHALGALGHPLSNGQSAAKKTGPVNPVRQLQGQYIGLLRTLAGQARQRVRATAKRDGVAAAVKLAKQLRHK